MECVCVLCVLDAGLVDEQQKVRTITALALAALAEAATPYGIESFDSVLKPLWKGIRMHRGKGLAAFLKVCCCRFFFYTWTLESEATNKWLILLQKPRHMCCY